jgi:hypothetical protein
MEMITVELDKPVYQKLEETAKNKGCTPAYLLTDIILQQTRTTEQDKDKEAQEKFAKAMGGNLITVNVQLFEPYVKFAKDYMDFFGVKYSLEIFIMKLAYAQLEQLHRDLTEFIHSKDHPRFVEGSDWWSKNPHLGITSDRELNEE